MTTQAKNAIFAAQNRNNWGKDAARHYAIKNSSLALYRLACQLEATKQFYSNMAC